MLRLNQPRNLSSFLYVQQQANMVELAGVARNVSAKSFMLEQSSANPEALLPIVAGEGDTIPRRIQDGSLVAVICHVFGRVYELPGGKTEYGVELRAIDVRLPRLSTLDKLPRFLRREDGTVSAEVTRTTFKERANRFRLAAYVQRPILDRRTQADGKTQSSLIVFLRQHADPKKLIPVRVPTPSKDTLRLAAPGTAISIFPGAVSVRNITDANGKLVMTIPSLRARELLVPDWIEIRDIAAPPDWVLELRDAAALLKAEAMRSGDALPTERALRVVASTPPAEIAARSSQQSAQPMAAEPQRATTAVGSVDWNSA